MAAGDGKDTKETEKMAQEAIEEARMVLPGIQALFGFQLIAVFNERFQQLPQPEQNFHFAAILLIALAIAIIMTPAAYHRQVEPGSVSPYFVRLASRLVTAAMVPLMLALCIEVYLLGHMAVKSMAAGIASAGLLFAVLFTLWFVFPAVKRKKSGRGADEGDLPRH
jgi:hypothetical protein